MAATVIIPARFASTRFPGKMLVAQTGRPLVQHVVDRVRQCKHVRQTIVAADDQRIVDALKPFNTICTMTNPDHPSGTDRIAEVARGLDDEIIINVQGDEPEIEPEVVDRLIERLEKGSDEMVTAATPFPKSADPADPNLVKVVVSLEGRAMYFSRAAIPFSRDGGSPAYALHLGIYGYRRAFLLKYVTWLPSPCEMMEKLEQLRALEHDVSIRVLKVDRASHGIDTAEQYARFVERFRKESA